MGGGVGLGPVQARPRKAGRERSPIPKLSATGAELAATGAPESWARRRAIFQKLQPQAPSWQPQAFRKMGGGEEEYSKMSATDAELALIRKSIVQFGRIRRD